MGYLHADHEASIIAIADQDGNPIAVNAYDEYGIPNSGDQGRFGYTGQAWIGELGMWDYKARFYSPTLGRFMQTDPIGYGAGMNWYQYVKSDPVNLRDSSGKCDDGGGRGSSDKSPSPPDPLPPCDDDQIIVTASIRSVMMSGASGGGGGSESSGIIQSTPSPNPNDECDPNTGCAVVITGQRLRHVKTTVYTGARIDCSFYGSRIFTVSVRNLEPGFDGIQIDANSFNTDANGNVIPIFTNPGGGPSQGGYLVPYRLYYFDFAASGDYNGNPFYHRVSISQRGVNPTGYPTYIQVSIDTYGGSGGCTG